jgi:cation diffusion facilitator family transporter
MKSLSQEPIQAIPASSGGVARQQLAIRISLLVGFLMLAGKTYAYAITGSAAILSDAAESVVHVAAVSFAAFSLWLSLQPPDLRHPYGHDKVSFFSAGVEGILIVIAAFFIIYASIAKWVAGLTIENLDSGTTIVAAAAAVNAGLGWYLVWLGKRHQSIILIANGKHVLTDSWTSLGVIAGLLLVLWTGWLPFDPILAIGVALNIVWSGGKLVRQSVGGLMDEGNPDLGNTLRSILDAETGKRSMHYHQLRFRNSGAGIWVEFHLLFPGETSVTSAHWQATEIEAVIKAALDSPVTITTHLEPAEQHAEVHNLLKNSGE